MLLLQKCYIVCFKNQEILVGGDQTRGKKSKNESFRHQDTNASFT